MCYEPFVAAVVAEQFGTRHEKNPPALESYFGFKPSKVLLKSTDDSATIAISILQPRLARLPVVQTTHSPLLLDVQVVVELGE